MKNATIIFDKKYEKCLQDIRIKDILGTCRIKQIKKKKVRLGQESNQRCLDYKTITQTTQTTRPRPKLYHVIEFKAFCKLYQRQESRSVMCRKKWRSSTSGTQRP